MAHHPEETAARTAASEDAPARGASGGVRSWIKRVMLAGAFLSAFPFYLIYRLNRLFLNAETAFQGLSQFMSMLPGLPGNWIRKGFYILTLRRCSPDCTISFGTLFSTPECEIGRHVYIGAYCVISDSIIGDDVLIGSHTHIISGKHAHSFASLDQPMRLQPVSRSVVHIGADSWIGNGALIMADVGRGSVVGAGSVVTREIAEDSVAAGNPARVLRKRTDIGRAGSG